MGLRQCMEHAVERFDLGIVVARDRERFVTQRIKVMGKRLRDLGGCCARGGCYLLAAERVAEGLQKTLQCGGADAGAQLGDQGCRQHAVISWKKRTTGLGEAERGLGRPTAWPRLSATHKTGRARGRERGWR